MRNQFKFVRAAVSGAAILMVAGCGGGDTTAAAPVAPAAPLTSNISTTVVDGAITDAVVCLDKNSNGQCDADEVNGRTDAQGKVTLAVPLADVGKYPLIAVVGLDAVDADHGKVLVPYTMSAPADKSDVVSPLTTLVQQAIASGATVSEATKLVQDAVGSTVALFEDFTLPNGNQSAKTLARLIVVTTQAHSVALAGAVDTKTLDDVKITRADLDKVIQKKLIELLPTLVSVLTQPDLLAATAGSATEDVLRLAAAAAVTASGLTPAALKTLVAVNNAPVVPVVVTAPLASIQLASLYFTNALNYSTRLFTSSLAQNTPDAANNLRYVERRSKSSAGIVANWGIGGDPTRNADLHWNGKLWANCPFNFENTASVRDAQGSNVYNYCDGAETGKGKRANFDIGGKPMLGVYQQIRDAGYTNLTLTEPTVLASATFPTGASLAFQSSMPLTTAIAYYPGSGSQVKQFSADVTAGVNSASGCLARTFPTTNASTLEAMISSHGGTPCAYTTASSFVYAGTTYSSGTPFTWDGNSTLQLGTIGTVALYTGTTAPGYYSGNTRIVVAFKGTGTNPVTYLACQERFTDGSPRNCKAIGTGSYKIETLGDARVMTLNNLPLQAAALTNTRVYVERGGAVYVGYQNKLLVTNSARLNTVASKALLTQIGIVPADPEVPLALTAASYQGSWDLHDVARPAGTGINVSISATGTTVCIDIADSNTFACSLTLTNAGSGAFTLTTAPGESASGSLDFMTGSGSGTFHDPSSTPADGSFVAQRR